MLAALKGVSSTSFADMMTSLDTLGKTIGSKNITVVDLGKTINDLKSVYPKRDGAKWIVKYVGDNGDHFAGKTLHFETKLEDSVRYMDIKDNTNELSPTLYEFKSVQIVQTDNFNAQFKKDLSKSNVTDLDQIEWLFDGAKSPSNFTSDLTNAVENLPLTTSMDNKFGMANVSELKTEIIDRFDDIFILVD
jgi:hypothetical protein